MFVVPVPSNRDGDGQSHSHSLTVSNGMGKQHDFERVVKQQQKAMKYFNQRHSKSRSAMAPLNENEYDHRNGNKNGTSFHSNDGSAGTQSAQRRYAWEWRDDDGEWTAYSVDTTTVIELAFESGLDAV